MMISMLVQAFYNVVDSIFVAQISENALNAVSLAFPLQNIMIAFGGGTSLGMNAILSRYLGEKNFEDANRAANTGISTVISDKGRIITSLPPLTDGYVFAEVSTSDQRTLFSYTGNLTVLLSAIYIAFLFVRAIILKIKAK
jgi:hypothetical protein